VLNSGDYLSIMANYEVVSPLHRVLLAPTERISFVLFAYPAWGARLPRATSAEAAQRHSLFADQSAEARGDARHTLSRDDLSTPFGELILRKWDSVSRRGGQPAGAGQGSESHWLDAAALAFGIVYGAFLLLARGAARGAPP
jgi:hypothetical protein